MSFYYFWRASFVFPGGQDYQHGDSLGQCAASDLISTLCLPRYDMCWVIDEKFRGFTAKIRDLMDTVCFVEVDARISGVLSSHSNFESERQGITTTACKGHQTTALSISGPSLCSRNMLCIGVASIRAKNM